MTKLLVIHFIWLDTSFVFVYLKAELRKIEFIFSAAILAAILENSQLLFEFQIIDLSVSQFILSPHENILFLYI